MAKTYCIGWVSRAARTEFLTQPEAPSNYKDQAKIREYREAAMDRLMAEASQAPVVGTLVSIYVEELANPGVPVLHETSETPGIVSKSVLDWLQRDDVEIALLYGFDAEILLEMAALETLANVSGFSGDTPVPYQLWKETGYIKDPYKMLCRSETRKFIALPQLVKFLMGQDFNPQAFTDPREQVRLARAIVRAGQLPASSR